MRRLLVVLRRAGTLALAVLVCLPVVAFLTAQPSLLLQALVAGLLVLTLARPTTGWLALVGLFPFGDFLARTAGSPLPPTEPLVLAFLAAWLAREAWRSAAPPSTGRRIESLPVALAGSLAVCVAASLVVNLAVTQISTLYPLDFVTFLFRFLWRDYFARPGDLSAVPGAAFVLEGLGIFIATSLLTARSRGLAATGARVVACAAGVVAIVNIAEFAREAVASVATSSWRALVALRVSHVFPDVNAAGSYFVMALFVAGGLAVQSERRARTPWLAVTALCVAGLWLSGSRTALFAAPLAAMVLAARVLRDRRRGTVAAVAAIAGLLLVVASAYAVTSLSQRGVQGAVRWRSEMAATALRMVGAHPVFGVGAGQFYELSYSYSSPDWRTLVPRENAHNNFLQVLAELGLLGFALVLWMIAGVVGPAFATRGSPRGDALLLGCATGLLAFCLTWLGGHPLLIREVALAFWVVLGLCLGLVAEVRPLSTGGHRTTRIRALHLLPWIIALVVVGSVPFRVRAEVLSVGIARAGMGFSQWHRTPEGTHFRWMGHEARFFVPSEARIVTLPVRSPRGSAFLRVFVDGKVVARKVLGNTNWQEVVFERRPASPGSYVPIDLLVGSRRPPHDDAPEPVGDDRVQVGMAAVR